MDLFIDILLTTFCLWIFPDNTDGTRVSVRFGYSRYYYYTYYYTYTYYYYSGYGSTIGGAVAGSIIFLAIVISLCVWCCIRASRARRSGGAVIMTTNAPAQPYGPPPAAMVTPAVPAGQPPPYTAAPYAQTQDVKNPAYGANNAFVNPQYQ